MSEFQREIGKNEKLMEQRSVLYIGYLLLVGLFVLSLLGLRENGRDDLVVVSYTPQDKFWKSEEIKSENEKQVNAEPMKVALFLYTV